MPAEPRDLAIYIDFENLAMGFPKRKDFSFHFERIADRLVEKGKIIVKVAYADWYRFRQYTQTLHEGGVELIEIPKRSMTGKNSADIRLCVDAMDLCYSKPHIDTFVIVSGDSDFTPLVSKLKENGKRVIGLAMRDSTSPLLANNCDEFIYYEDLSPPREKGTSSVPSDLPKDQREVYNLLLDAVRALQRENMEVLYASLVKDTMRRKRPSFDESSYGYRSFSDLLESAEEAGLVKLVEDERSGTFVVRPLGRARRRKR